MIITSGYVQVSYILSKHVVHVYCLKKKNIMFLLNKKQKQKQTTLCKIIL